MAAVSSGQAKSSYSTDQSSKALEADTTGHNGR